MPKHAYLSALAVGDTITGYTQYIPDDAISGLTLTALSDDPAVASVSVSGQNVTVTGVAPGETLVHVSIPYGGWCAPNTLRQGIHGTGRACMPLSSGPMLFLSGSRNRREC